MKKSYVPIITYFQENEKHNDNKNQFLQLRD